MGAPEPDTSGMLNRLSSWLGGGNKPPAPPVIAPSQVQSSIAGNVDPGPPYHQGEPVPRWPEQGAALLAASPDSLLETQAESIKKIRSFSPMLPAHFDKMVMPVFRRYAEWVHLLPASEAHHHFGPGGLLAHGFEVALHSARIADGRQVGTQLNPSERSKYQPRWKVATMLCGMLHDLGKPITDCGATDVDRTITWSRAVSLHQWLLDNRLSSYRIYWRSGPRHERHKPVGTSLVREILGPEMIHWLSDEPTNEVMDLFMSSIATGRVASNLMSVVVSQADSLSVEADLKRLAERTKGTGQGGMQSIGALVMSQMRQLMESNVLKVNKPGELVWVTSEGCFGAYPKIFEAARQALVGKQVNGIPASTSELAQLMADTGFIVPVEEKTASEHKYSNTWNLKITVSHKDVETVLPPIQTIRFANPDLLFGNLPRPGDVPATAHPPFMTKAELDKIESEVTVAAKPQSQESALGIEPTPATTPPPTRQGNAGPESSPATPEAVAEPTAPTEQQEAAESNAEAPAQQTEPPAPAGEPAIETRRNRRDRANEHSVEIQRRRDLADAGKQHDIPALLARIEKAGLGGPALVEVLRRIASQRLKWGESAFETTDGLVVRYPHAMENLGMPPGDLLVLASENRWLVTDAGSDRKVTEREFPSGGNSKCVIFTDLIARTWQAIRHEYPLIVEGQAVELPGEEEIEQEPAPSEQRTKPAPVARDGEPRQARPSPGPKATVAQGQANSPRTAGGSGRAGNPANGWRDRQGPPTADKRPQGADRGAGSSRVAASQATKGSEAPTPKERMPAPQSTAAAGGVGPAKRPATQVVKGRDREHLPAVGAELLPEHVARAEQQSRNILSEPISEAGKRELARKAGPAPQPRRPDPTRREDHGVTVSKEIKAPPALRRDRPRSKEDYKCERIEDLNPTLISFINGGLHMRRFRYQVQEPDFDIDQTKFLLSICMAFGRDNEVRQPVLITALMDPTNPAFLIEQPKSMALAQITSIKPNPDYVEPEWVVAMKKQILEKKKKVENG